MTYIIAALISIIKNIWLIIIIILFKVALCTTTEDKLKFKITVYFVTSVQRLILNFISAKLQHINNQKDGDALDPPNIKRVGQSFYIETTFGL